MLRFLSVSTKDNFQKKKIVVIFILEYFEAERAGWTLYSPNVWVEDLLAYSITKHTKFRLWMACYKLKTVFYITGSSTYLNFYNQIKKLLNHKLNIKKFINMTTVYLFMFVT